MAFTKISNFSVGESTFLKESFDISLRDLCERAAQLGWNLEESMQWTQKAIKWVNAVFDDVYIGLQPSQADRLEREYVIQFLDNVVRHKIPGSRIVAFGSYVMDMFTSRSDLDLSLTLGDEDCSRDDKLRCLKRLRKSLYQLENGTECDISVENKDGVLKSTLLRIFSSIDRRFRQLCFLLKHWAKAQGVNNPKEGTLSSFAIILLVAFHLQTRSPPIFPPFSVFLEGLDLKASASIFSEVQRRVEGFKGQSSGRINTENLSQLFATFLAKLVAVEDLWQQGLCASTFEGRWISKRWANNNVGIISVEDLTDRMQNSARAVSRKEFDRVYQCFKNSLAAIQNTLTGKPDSDDLASILFVSHVKTGKRRSEEPPLFSKEKQQKLDPPVGRLLQQTANLNDYIERERLSSPSGTRMHRQVGHVSVLRQEQLQYQQPPVPYITNQEVHFPHYVTTPALMPLGMQRLVERPYVPAVIDPQMGFPSNEYLSQKVLLPEHVGYDANRYNYPYNHRDFHQIQVQPWVDRKLHMVRRRM